MEERQKRKNPRAYRAAVAKEIQRLHHLPETEEGSRRLTELKQAYAASLREEGGYGGVHF